MSSRSSLRLAVLLALSFVASCAAAGDFESVDARCFDAGGGDGEECDPDSDGERVAPPPPPQGESDDGGEVPQNNAVEVACLSLVEQVCGVGEPPPCADAPACAAAGLLRAHEPGSCEAALDNDVTYPDCRPGPCVLLVDRVCGGEAQSAPCAEAPGCDPAKELLERSSSSNAQDREDAEASCNAALEDDVVFAPCS